MEIASLAKATTRKLKTHLGKKKVVRYVAVTFNYAVNIHPRLKRQLGYCTASPKGDGDPRILVPMIETSHYQFYQILALAKALELRGAKIKLLLCGSQLSGCEIKSIRTGHEDPCFTCRFNHKNVVPFFDFDVAQLSDYITEADRLQIRSLARQIATSYPARYVYEGVNVIPMTNDSVIRYYYGAQPAENSDELRDIRRQHLETSMIGVKVARTIFESWQPDQLIGNMNVYSAWEPYLRVSAEKGVKFNLVSMSTFDYSRIVLNRPDLYMDNRRFTKWLKQRNSEPLTTAETRELAEFMASRFDGTCPIFKNNQVFNDGAPDLDFLKIDKQKRNIFLFSNIYWDAGLAEYASLYEGVVEWVLDSIDMLKDRSDCQLYIKPHPAEVYDPSSSLKGVIDFVRERYPMLPSNVTIIPPQLKIKPYDLFPVIDVGVVYNGTLAMEMLLRNIPVIGAGLSPFGHLRSLSNPTSRDEYARLLKGEKVVAQPDREEVQLFAFFYFIRTLIPWTLTKQAFADKFKGFAFESLDALMPGKDVYLDHLCHCILHPEDSVVEGWVSSHEAQFET